MHSRFTLHFSHLPVIQRVLYSCALLVLGLGYLFAMVHIYSSHHGRDGEPMLSVKDIAIAYRGSTSGTKLESALRGPMSGMLPADENKALIAWLHAGAAAPEYEAVTKAIFDNRCIACHNNRNPHLPSLESYEGVKAMAEEDHGADLFTLVRVSHIHLFGLTFIFFIVGSIFIHAYMRYEWVKIAIITTPFIAIALDIASWYITKISEPFAYVVIGSGALMGASFAFQFVVSLYQMWFYRLPKTVEQEFYCTTVKD